MEERHIGAGRRGLRLSIDEYRPLCYTPYRCAKALCCATRATVCTFTTESWRLHQVILWCVKGSRPRANAAIVSCEAAGPAVRRPIVLRHCGGGASTSPHPLGVGS